jgi:integrase
VESHSNIVQRGFEPIQIAAGIMEPKRGQGRRRQTDDGPREQIRAALPTVRLRLAVDRKRHEPEAHPDASLMGHSTIQMTFDVYGHLFTDGDADQRAAEDIQIRLLGN